MKAYLQKGNKKVATINIIFGLEYINFFDIKLYNEIPYSWKNIANSSQTELEQFVSNWFEYRTVHPYRENIDAYIQDLLNIWHPGYGRMYDFRHIPALLSCFVSAFDDYVLIPENDKHLYFGREDGRVTKIYTWSETGIQHLRNTVNTPNDCIESLLNKRIDKNSKRDMYSFSTTIHSKKPSFIRKNNERIYLMQKLSDHQNDHEIKVIKTISDLYFPCNISKNYLKIDISEIYQHGTVTWLSEYLPYIKTKKCIDEQYSDIISKCLDFNISNMIFEIFRINKDIVNLDINQVGFAILPNGFFPVIIL